MHVAHKNIKIKDCNTDKNIFVRYSRDDTMEVQELQNIMAEYGKIKSIKVLYHQNGGREKRAMLCYEKQMEVQRAITEISRYEGWRGEKYITNKATRTGNQFNDRTNTSSRETETEENDRGKTNQSGKKDKRTCYTCGAKNIFTRNEENIGGIWNCKKYQNKKTTNRTDKHEKIFFSRETEVHEAIIHIMQKYIKICIIKKALAKFQAYMKINRNLTQTEKRKKKKILKRN